METFTLPKGSRSAYGNFLDLFIRFAQAEAIEKSLRRAALTSDSNFRKSVLSNMLLVDIHRAHFSVT